MNNTEKLAALRNALADAGVDGFILPVADEYLGEYVPPSAQRLGWLTGFTGSAGMVAILPNKAAFFTDGRYTLQARVEVEETLYIQFNSATLSLSEWLVQQLPLGAKLAYDPMLHSVNEIERLQTALAPRDVALVSLVPNPIDLLWTNRPAPSTAPAFVHDVAYAGISHDEKRSAAARTLQEKNADALVLAASDSINWLLNIRGHDLAYTPVVLGYTILTAQGRAELYADPAKFSMAVLSHLGEEVAVLPQAELPEALHRMGTMQQRVMLDPRSTPMWFAETLRANGAEIIYTTDPCMLPKAVKNGVELEGMRRAHKRDGLAVTRFLWWLDTEIRERGITELEAAARLLEYRRNAPEFFSPSFETIAGSGPNGAIVHYRVTEATDRVLNPGDIFLLDSGGQYPDGTTDVTRTVALVKATREQRERFTQVLKGHIRLAATSFPEGTSGSQLDTLARAALWQAGLDFDHSTGHGVGSFLSVHEGPQRIGKRGADSPLKPGMVVSNEPGYYKEGAYGIRIESLLTVVTQDHMENGMQRLGFETLTCVPIDRRLIMTSLLASEEKQWLNRYHAWVYKTLAPTLSRVQRRWLRKACRRIW